MGIKVFQTTSEDTHSHKWREGDEFTSKDIGFVSNFHKHRVEDCVALPISRSGHSHKVIGRK